MRKLAIFAAGYAAAAFLAVLVLPEDLLVVLAVCCALVCLALALLRRLIPDGVRRRAFLCAVGLTAGFLWTWCYSAVFLAPAKALDDRTVELTGTVTDWPEQADYSARVTIRVPLRGGTDVLALVYVDKEHMDLQPGDRISTIAHVSLASRSVRGEEITYYTSKGIFLTAKAYGQLQVERPERIPVTYLGPQLTRALGQSVHQVFPAQTRGLFQALITGDKSGLDESFESSLQRTGLSHVVVVSGMHLAYLSALIGLLLGPGRKRTALVTIPFVLVVAAMAGFTPSIVRAAVMLIMLQLAPIFGREGDGPTSLCFALLLLLIQNPYCAASISLQLSFGAVCGIMLLTVPLQQRMMQVVGYTKPDSRLKKLWNRVCRFITGVVAASLGAMVFTVPVLVVCFGKISLISPISNLLCIWAVSVSYLGGMVAAVLGLLLPGAGALVGALTAPFAGYLLEAIPALAQLPLASVPVTNYYYTVWLILVYGLVALGVFLPGKKHTALALGVGGAALAAAVLFTGMSFRSPVLTASVLDVGQGQSVLLYTPDAYVLVDCGGNDYTNAGDIAADTLGAMGQGRLDALVISHYHDDHANGVPQLLERVQVDRLYLPDVADETGLRDTIEAQAGRTGTRLIYVRDTVRAEFGSQGVLTIYPPLGQEDANERCLSVLCSVDRYDVLMTGDMDSELEQQLLEKGLPDVEMIVAGHHGSKYSSCEPLLRRVKPEVAVFSVGITNSYGHPAPEVLERFSKVGAQLYRTDLMGTVTVKVHQL